MLPDRVSNPGPLTYESGALPIALRGPALVLLIVYLPLIVYVSLDVYFSQTVYVFLSSVIECK